MQFTFKQPEEQPKFLSPISEGSLAWLAWEELETHRGQSPRQIGTFSKAIKIAKDARENSPGTLPSPLGLYALRDVPEAFHEAPPQRASAAEHQ